MHPFHYEAHPVNAMVTSMMIWIAVAGAVAMTVWRFVLQRRRPKRSQGNLPPGTVGWPLLVEFIPFIFRTQEFMVERREMYGNVFRTSIFGKPMVISTDPDVNKFILHNEDRLFVPQYPSHFTRLLGKWNIFAARGDFHKRMRGTVLRFVNISVVKDRLLSEIQNIMTSRLSGWGGRNVDVMQEAQEMIFSLMANHLLSFSASTELDNMKRDFCDVVRGVYSVPLNVPGTTFYKSLQKRQKLSNQIKSIIEERKKNMSSNHSYDDLLSATLKDAAEREAAGKIEFTTDQIVDLIVLCVFAAIETTPRTMALIVKRLSENPHIIPELREEHEAIKRTQKNNESLSWEDYKSMEFTRSVIKETLRFGNPPLNNLLFRKTIENVEVEGFTIPKGWTCIVYDQFTNMNSKYYTNPLVFNPRRWQDNDSNQAPFLAFGGGPRLCPGYELAMLVISFFLHHLVTKFKWEYFPNTKSKWFEIPFISIVDCKIHVETRCEH